jgi:CRISPR-associated endonuclease/helicase Cas3
MAGEGESVRGKSIRRKPPDAYSYMVEETGTEETGMGEAGRPFIAHWREARGTEYDYVRNRDGELIRAEVQTIADHLKNTSALAAGFADAFGAGEYAGQIGLAHDIGKYSSAFQKRIWENAPKTDHSTAGAKEMLAANKNAMGMAAAYCIAGHHAGLLNGGSQMDSSDTTVSLHARLNKNLKDDYCRYAEDIELRQLPRRPDLKTITLSGGESGYFSFAFWTRMLFSCLVDADFLDTESFADYGVTGRDPGENLCRLKEKLDSHIDRNKWLKGTAGINALRSRILQNCIDGGKKSADGIFTLTVPTGGGKTIASMAFAMNQAVALKKRRIIYVIPYCSIIDQTTAVFSGIFGDRNVLAHYSGAAAEEKENEPELDSRILATENWDKPIVVTTAVQFFESLFASKTSRCRKLHNICNSVIIFDEAQTLPQPYLKPCIAAIRELTVNYRCTGVFCTATQPALNRFIEKCYINRKETEIKIQEICENTEELYRAFRRVTYENAGRITDEALAKKLSEYEQVLCIVSTRKQAYRVYGLMQGEGCYHLSKCMTSVHIKRTIAEMKDCLLNGKPCRVVATSLVEAGVDLDFPVVYRAKAGLDSIIQAGGRCNREGKRAAEVSKVYIFEPEETYMSKLPPAIQRQSAITDIVTGNAKDIADLSVVNRYFNSLYNNLDSSGPGTSDGLDTKHIVESFEDTEKFLFPFADAANRFRIIDSNTISVFVPSDETSRVLAEKLQDEKARLTAGEYRTAGEYCVNVYPDNLKKISGSVTMINEHFGILAVKELYDSRTGLKFEDEGGYGIMA